MGLAAAYWIMAVVAVLAALGVVFLRNVFRAALSLVLCFITVAGLYITLSADFLAAVQILVYVGAISVLIILAVMMTREVQQGSPANRLKIPAFIVAAVVLGIMIYTVTATSWQVASAAPLAPTTVPLAGKLFSESGFILPVEIAAMLILAAILGAIVIAREK
ncbi:MAG TPA: NADH-quinone oxidoreductase subunit J [Dehalococcoidales bacterium]|nr:MAG: NADH-quinone oxidoreductase subunit L [Chloroflexi bacterium RBG_16_60_22]HJX12256.1 NADH-quinone oxidoreductase subunit J [Dehalococcoidales bacterium]